MAAPVHLSLPPAVGAPSAACAQQHAADVLHVDRHFDLLGTVLTFRSLRLDG